MERFSPPDVATFWLGTTPQQYRNYYHFFPLTKAKFYKIQKNLSTLKMAHIELKTPEAQLQNLGKLSEQLMSTPLVLNYG